MFNLEKPVVVRPARDITDIFEGALRTKGIRVERVTPAFRVQTITGCESKEITTRSVSDIDYIVAELVRINPYVVHLLEVKKIFTPTETYFQIRLDFIAPMGDE